MEERRSEPRYEVNDSVVVHMYRTSNESTFGHIVNISANGLALVVTRALIEGEVIRIDVGKCVLLGTVLRCRRSDDHYSVGLQLVYSMTTDQLRQIVGRDIESGCEGSAIKLIAGELANAGCLRVVQRLLHI